MHISRAQISGFSTFRQTPWVEFSPGFNVVVGKNNSGKSTFLTALAGRMPPNKHRNPDAYTPGDTIPARCDIEFKSTRSEFRKRLSEYGEQISVAAEGSTTADQNNIVADILDEGEIILHCNVMPGQSFKNSIPTFLNNTVNSSGLNLQLSMSNGEIQFHGISGNFDTTIMPYNNSISQSVFYISSERYHRSNVGFGRYENLDSNASNLAGYLSYLIGNSPKKFSEIISRVCEIIPSVEDITVDNSSIGFSILIWPKGSLGNRQLAFEMESCGTGISQVLSIAAAAATHTGAVIIIDEISSFIHPSAVKDLMSALQVHYSENQYIISAHSPEVMSHPAVDRIIYIDRTGFDVTFRNYQRVQVSDLKACLREIGVSMTDLLGCDRMLWVEGATEEAAFPILIRKFIGAIPHGVRIAAVRAPADFSKGVRGKVSAIEIFERVVEVAAPFVDKQTFLLDRESLSDEEVECKIRANNLKIAFLSRRCIENFVLDPQVIERAVLREIPGSHISFKDIQRSIGDYAAKATVA
jgi:predicted ATPase